jgi:hypothetical protein
MWLGPDRRYRRDSYGRYREDRSAQRRGGVPARLAVIALAVLAGITVAASLLQSFYHWLGHL